MDAPRGEFRTLWLVASVVLIAGLAGCAGITSGDGGGDPTPTETPESGGEMGNGSDGNSSDDAGSADRDSTEVPGVGIVAAVLTLLAAALLVARRR